MDTNELICTTETYSQTWKNYGSQRGQVGGGGGGWGVGGRDWGFAIGICALRSMEGMASGDLLYCTENSTSCSVIVYVRKASERECVYVHVTSWCSRNYHSLVN